MTIHKVSDLPHNIPFGQKFVILDNNVAYSTHNIHKYPSKFIPHIPRWAIAEHLKGQKFRSILDPMCGSGTTLVEGILAGHYAYGIDIDPLARLISKVKITSIDESELQVICEEVKEAVKSRNIGAFVPSIPTLRHWFNEDAIRDLSVIRDVIDEYRDQKDVYDFLIVTFSSIIRRVSNADNQSQKTYVSHTNPKKPSPVKPEFIKHLIKYSERIRDFSRRRPYGTNSLVFDADAREVDDAFKKQSLGKADLVITSPPYIKAVDIIYTQMAEYFWIGDLFGLEDQKSQNMYKQRYIGTKSVYADEYSNLRLTGIPSIDPLIKKIYGRNPKFAHITWKFFDDMISILGGIYKILDDDAHFVVVVGDCSVSGERIPVHEVLVDIAKLEDYVVKNLFCYEIRNRYMRFPRKGRGGLITHDWVLDFAKT